jgi:hypothetical protein
VENLESSERTELDFSKVYEIALDEGRRSVAAQEVALTELRSRTNMLIGAASVIVSFLGAQALDDAGWSELALLAMLAFLATLVLAGSVLWPSQDAWLFRVDPRILIEDFTDGTPPVGTSAERHLAESLGAAAEHNSRQLNGMYVRFRLALVALGAQAVMWALLLANH